MNTGKQINAMVIVLFLSLIAIGAYTLWDPLRSDSAEDNQLEKAASFGATTFSLNCRLCHGDRGEGGAAGGRLPAALALDIDRLRGIKDGVFDQAAFADAFKLMTDTITCGRVGTSMPTWGESQGGILSDEQLRQLAVLITEGRWDLAQEHADEVDAAATNHATVQMPDGSFGVNDTELIVSNAAPFSVDQFIRIEEERLQIIDIPSTGQRLAGEIGRTPRRLLVSGAEAIEVGAIIRLDGELMEVTAVRDDGDPEIVLGDAVSPSEKRISVSDAAFFGEGYVLSVGDELIEVDGPVETGQTLSQTVGRAETTIEVSGIEGIPKGMVIRIGRELMRVVELEPARLEVERGVEDTEAASHGSGTSILEVDVAEAEEPDTGQTLIEPADPSDTLITVSGTTGIAEMETYRLDNELVFVKAIQRAHLHVERGVEGSSRAAHARRVAIFEGNLLAVERGVDGTRRASHDEGEQVFLTELEVKRALEGSDRQAHAKNAEIYLGHRLIVERGVLDTEAAEHPNGVLVRDFPPPPEDPAINKEACGDQRFQVFVGGPTPTVGPTATPRAGAQQVAVSLTEFEVAPEVTSIGDGPVDFQVSNEGVIVHNFRVIATDLAVDELPLDDTGLAVDETQVEVVGGFVEAITGGESRSAPVDLPPGNYVLICNVATHYQAGMWVGFEVAPP